MGGLRLIRSSGRPSDDVALGAELLALGAPALRVYQPHPTLGFGRLDARLPGYGAAAAAAQARGFAPVMRAPGGHAAAYHSGSLVIEVFGRGGIDGVRGRFAQESGRIAGALRSLGVDARVGEVPGEHCPGAWSVSLAGRVKLAGLAQRVARGAWMLGAELLVEDPEPVRAVLVDVYRALELPFDPATVGAAGVGLDAVERAVLAAYGDPCERA